jgi:hypothetical protein
VCALTFNFQFFFFGLYKTKIIKERNRIELKCFAIKTHILSEWKTHEICFCSKHGMLESTCVTFAAQSSLDSRLWSDKGRSFTGAADKIMNWLLRPFMIYLFIYVFFYLLIFKYEYVTLSHPCKKKILSYIKKNVKNQE